MCASRQLGRRRLIRRTLTALGCAIAVVLAAPAAEARRSGELTGTVKDSLGAPLSGATVTLTGHGAPQVQATDSQGTFRFRQLTPGNYTVEVKHASHQTVTTTVRVGVYARPILDVQLATAADFGSISVTGDSPFQSSQNVSWTSDDLTQIPTARDPWSVLQQTPGVLVDRINVGGNEAGQPSRYVGPGAPVTGAVWMVDGTVVTDMTALGSSPAYYDFDSFEELQVTTGGSDASTATGGVVLNMVTKSGGNEFRGRASFFGRLGDAPDPLPARSAGLDGGYDYGVTLGGPAVRDRLWYFVSHDTESLTVERNGADAVPVDADVDNRQLFGKLQWSPAPGHFLVGSYLDVDTDLAGAGAGFGRNASSTSDRTNDFGLMSARYNGRLTDSLFVELAAAQSDIDATETPRDGVPSFGLGAWSGSYANFTSERASETVRGSLEYLADTSWGDHELKTGVTRRTYSEDSTAAWESGGFTLTDGPFPVRVLTPANTWAIEGSATSFYLEDMLRTGRLTANLGLRYDRETASNLSSQLLANPGAPSVVPGGTYPGGDAFEWEQVSPRLGMTYALGADRRTLLRASYSRFADQLGTITAAFENPLATVPAGYMYAYTFIDSNANLLRESTEARGAGVRIGPPGNAADAFSDPTRLSTDLTAPKVDEWVTGFSHTLGDWMLGVDVVGRTITGALQDLPLVSDGGASRYAQFDDYVIDPSIDVVDGYRLRSGLTQTGVERRNGDGEQEYLGATLYVSKRLANRWMLRGHYTQSDWTWSVPDSTLGDPNDLIENDDNDGAPVSFEGGPGRSGLFLNSGWSFDVSGLYQVAPDRPWGVDLGWNVNGREGGFAPDYATVRGGDGVTRRVLAGESDRRLPNTYMLNLRVGTNVSIGRSRLGLSVEVANVTGADTAQQEDRDRTSAGFGTITDRLGGRAVRIGGVIQVR